MKNTILAAAAVSLLLTAVIPSRACAGTDSGQIAKPPMQSSPADNPATKRVKPRMQFVTIAEFYLPDGKAVSGKLVVEDKNQVVIEERVESMVTTRSYSKREMDSRSLTRRKVPEAAYYTDLARYFAARTWDFRDDPDDFILAIRAYEKAKQSIQDSDRGDPAEIDRAIEKLREDREIWTRQVESRAKLKDLEFEAELPKRLKQIEERLAESAVRLDESVESFKQTATDIAADNQRIKNSIVKLNQDFTRQLRLLDARIVDNRAAINNIWYRGFVLPGPSSSGTK